MILASSRVMRNKLFEVSEHVPRKPASTTKNGQPRHLGFKKKWKKWNCTIREMKIKAMPTQSIHAFVFASEKVSFLMIRLQCICLYNSRNALS